MKKITKKHICEKLNELLPNHNFNYIYRNLRITKETKDAIHAVYGRFTVTYHKNEDKCTTLYGLLSC